MLDKLPKTTAESDYVEWKKADEIDQLAVIILGIFQSKYDNDCKVIEVPFPVIFKTVKNNLKESGIWKETTRYTHVSKFNELFKKPSTCKRLRNSWRMYISQRSNGDYVVTLRDKRCAELWEYHNQLHVDSST